jgi:hypothetical protein
VRTLLMAVVMALAGNAGLNAQTPNRTRADSIARADSIRIVRELEAMGRRDSANRAPAQRAGSSNPRFIPDISAIGEFIGDFTKGGSTQESGRRFDIREVELAIQAAVDPYFRADVILGLSDLEGIAIEESYLTAVALPFGLQARLGRFHMSFGKQNTTHRAELQAAVEYPYVIQRFLGPEGGKGTGLWLSKIGAPFGFYQELILTAVDRLGEAPEDLVAVEPSNKKLTGLGYSARLRNYWDLSEAANVELSASAMTGRREQPIAPSVGPVDVNAALARQTTVGVDFTFRWRPLQQGLYKSLIVQGEFMKQFNEESPELPSGVNTDDYGGPTRSFSGAYLFARYQLKQRSFLGTRVDWMQDPEVDGRVLRAVSLFYQLFPSEFSKFVLGIERVMPRGERATNRLLLQSTFAVGPHRPHPF